MATASNLASDRKLRILLADDQVFIRKMVRTVLEGCSDFEVCGEATDGATAVEEALRLKPDVVVLNVSVPILSGFEAAREIKSKQPESAIVILSSRRCAFR
jgi:DNA-binding NarL/FixJ family response regulator